MLDPSVVQLHDPNMLDNPLDVRVPVSVIIPCYNCEATIRRAVKSVVEQTHKPMELILVNDGSQDDTISILKSLQGEFGRDWIKILDFSKNRGPSYARNAGWNAASCPYIAFLDSDDSWHPQKLAIQYEYMANHPDVVLTGHRWILVKNLSRVSIPLSVKYKKGSVSKLKYMLISHYFSTPTVMLKANIPYRFPEDMHYSEDRFLYLRIISAGNKAVFLDVPLAYLYKEAYGQGGLTKSIWRGELGELACFYQLYKLKCISKIDLFFCISLSIIKFIRRGCIVLFKKLFYN